MQQNKDGFFIAWHSFYRKWCVVEVNQGEFYAINYPGPMMERDVAYLSSFIRIAMPKHGEE